MFLNRNRKKFKIPFMLTSRNISYQKMFYRNSKQNTFTAIL